MAIGDLRTRLRAKFTRRYSAASSLSQSSADGEAPVPASPARIQSHKARSLKSRASLRPPSIRSIFGVGGGTATIDEKEDNEAHDIGVDIESEAVGSRIIERDTSGAGARLKAQESSDRRQSPASAQAQLSQSHSKLHEGAVALVEDQKHDSSSTADFPTPNTDIAAVQEEEGVGTLQENTSIQFSTPDFSTNITSSKERPPELYRRQSILPQGQTRLIRSLLETELPPPSRAANLDYFTTNGPSTISANMVSRKIWVKRPGASATLITIHEDDLVDDVRDMILKKYANSLGRSFDAPDVVLRIVSREQPRQERILGPEEEMGRTLDAYFPGGQAVDEALIIEVPVKRTPKPSPQAQRAYYDEIRPTETGTEYFPPMPVPATHSPHLAGVPPANMNGHHAVLPQHSMSVISTGQVPPLPSPGGTRRHVGHRRPAIGRTHTSSPTIVTSQAPVSNNGMKGYIRGPRSRAHSSASEKSTAPPVAPPLPSPVLITSNDLASQIQRTATPPPRISSPRPVARPKKNKKTVADHPSLPAGLLNGAVPPINVLIVEDNIINLKLLEAFMKRLKVRWQTAMNGREAVTKWRAGGFHLVLMDIQLPIMSGLEATKEIRRLERLNSIGVFSSSASSSAPEQEADEPEGEDKLPSTVLFKSPVIIVALTASSLQSDRHEALAAGCNDFLTKVSTPNLLLFITKCLNSMASPFSPRPLTPIYIPIDMIPNLP
jgi:osomolarity two-component system response regulator SSK1